MKSVCVSKVSRRRKTGNSERISLSDKNGSRTVFIDEYGGDGAGGAGFVSTSVHLGRSESTFVRAHNLGNGVFSFGVGNDTVFVNREQFELLRDALNGVDTYEDEYAEAPNDEPHSRGVLGD